MMMVMAASSLPGSFPGYTHVAHSPPDFSFLLKFHLNALQHLRDTQVQDCKLVIQHDYITLQMHEG